MEGSLQKIIRSREISEFTGYGLTAINEMIARGEFPEPVPLGKRAVGFLEAEVLAWQRKRIAARDKDIAAGPEVIRAKRVARRPRRKAAENTLVENAA